MLSPATSPASSAGAFAATAPAGSGAAPAAARCRSAARHLRAAGRRQAARAVARTCHGRLRRLRVLAGIHGQFTFETKKCPRTLAFERGVVESASSAAISVRAPDGTTWTWDLVSNTVVRKNHRPAARTALAAGQHVFVGGPVSGGANDARLVVIRAASSASGSW
jgi:predicted dehydrogenase